MQQTLHVQIYIYNIYISNTVIFLYYAGDRKNLNRGKLLKHARPLNNFFAEKGEYIYAPKRKRSNQNLKIEKIRNI